MNRILKLLLVLSLGLSACAWPGMSKTVTIDNSRAIKVIGPIGIGAAAQAAKIVALTAASKQPIYLVINTPGGDVSTGLLLLDALEIARNQGVEINCVVVGKAFSMGFNLLPSCSRVYALPGSEFLFHPVRFMINGPVTQYNSIQWHWELANIDAKFIPNLLRYTGFSSEFFLGHFIKETFWSASDLLRENPKMNLTIVNNIEGLTPDVFAWPSTTSERRGELLKTLTTKKRIILIRPEYIQ